MNYQLAAWARRNKRIAIPIVILTTTLLAVLSYNLGLYLYAIGYLMPLWLGVVFLLFSFGIRSYMLRVEKQKDKSDKQGYFYRHRKSLRWLYLSCFCLYFFVGNQLIVDFQMQSAPTNKTTTSQLSLSHYLPIKPGKKNAKKKKGWYRKSLEKRAAFYKKWDVQKVNKANVVAVIFIILLTILVILALGYLTVFLACAAACSDYAVLAVLAIIGGLGLMALAIVGCVKWIKYLNRSSRKKDTNIENNKSDIKRDVEVEGE